MKQIGLLLRLYFNPLAGFSRVLDEGRLMYAALAAIAVLLALQVPRAADHVRAERKAVMQTVNARVASAVAKATEKATEKGSAPSAAMLQEMREDIQDAMSAEVGPPPVWTAAARFVGQNPTQYFSLPIAMAICFVPMLILVLTVWDGLGGFTTILFRDYMPLIVCCLLAWTAPYLLLLSLNGALGILHVPAYNHPALWWMAHAWFLVLTALGAGTLTGAKFAHAIGATAGAWAAAVAGIWVYGMFGQVSGYLASPFVLFYLYRGIAPQLGGLGGGLQSRQRLKQGLENATLNPRDAMRTINLD